MSLGLETRYSGPGSTLKLCFPPRLRNSEFCKIFAEVDLSAFDDVFGHVIGHSFNLVINMRKPLKSATHSI